MPPSSPPHARNGTLPLAVLLVCGQVAGCAEPNHSPTLDPVGDQVVVVGQELVVELTARDPDGDALAFSLENAPEGASVAGTAAGGELRWAPLISQVDPGGKTYSLTVRVDDGRGGRAEQVVHITAYPEGGVPVFLNPSGFVINLAHESRVAFLIEVKDDDTDPGQMTLRLVSGIEGAEFQVINGKSASFYWKPTPEQIAESSYYSVVVGADDGVHAEVQQEISIILLNAETGQCEGSPPSIQHVPVGDAHEQAGIAVTAEATDGESTVSAMTLLWAVGQDATDADMKSVPMTLEEHTWTATIPELGLAGSESVFVRYALVATDNDDITGSACDKTTRSPKTGAHWFVAYGPDATGSCKEDALEPNDTAGTAAALEPGVRPLLRSCGGDDDWYAITVPAGSVLGVAARFEPTHGKLFADLHLADGSEVAKDAEGVGASLSFGPAGATTTVLARVGSAEGTALTYSLSVELNQGTCTNDPHEPNDGPGAAVPLGPGVLKGLVVCPGDRDWFAVTLGAGQHIEAGILFDQMDGDLDATLYAPDGLTPVASSETETSDELISYDADTGGTYLLEVRGFADAANGYDLAISVVDQSAVCKEDILAPNQAPEDAVALPAGSFTGMTLCPGTSDWFQYGLNGGETFQVLVTPEAGQALGVQIRTADGTAVGTSDATDEGILAEAVTKLPGEYLIEVTSTGASAVPYSVALAAEDLPGPCKNDRFEPNDTQETARKVSPGVLTRGKLCAGDQDWFRISGGAFEVVTLWALYDDADGDVDLRLLDADGEIVGEGKEGSDEELLEVLLPEGGDYWVKVSGAGIVDSAYDLVFYLDY